MTVADREFRVLGPVEVYDVRTGLRIVPPGSKQRTLLAALVVEADRPLSVDRLAEELWGERQPANAANAVQAHVARLRRLLQAHGPAGHEWIRTEPAGYLLRLGPATTDARRFELLSAEARGSTATDPARAAELLRRALSLWRGRALQDIRHGPVCATEADRLEEHRLMALEAMYEAYLRSGRCEGVLGELERLTDAYPLRERFYDLLMAALHRSGRGTEALGVYERARVRLADQLGVAPGPALRGRMEAMMRDSAPSAPDAAVPPADFGAEIARIGRRLEELSREYEVLRHRFEKLTTGHGLSAHGVSIAP
ncbi:BTAD domain-containing putative transcriptional regulator [Streptomyces monticola]|uniref:BTAD domain-containing putative transcriptional regulator n=1 Tax=Streptomyces monticola TaxID=2666263 RepID=A0ABW2JWD1_9ACTN